MVVWDEDNNGVEAKEVKKVKVGNALVDPTKFYKELPRTAKRFAHDIEIKEKDNCDE